MKCNLTIKISLADERLANATAKALEGVESELKKRTLSNISINNKTVVLKIISDDVVALRASVNGYLRQLQAIESVEGEKIKGNY